MKREEAVSRILDELDRAEEKFPEWPRDPIHAAAIVAEEAGELTQASLQTVYQDGHSVFAMMEEATQTAAMAIRFLMHYNDYAAVKSPQVKS